MKKLPSLLILSLMFVGLQACGQTGPLYLPDEAAPVHVEKD